MRKEVVSVIIPVFNAEKFVKEAVESALIQPEVKEILLIEDNSTDNSLEICKQIVQLYPEKVKLFQHKNKKNNGAGASRNIGLKNATGDYIAFLDADDFYLPERFKETFEILAKTPSLDGVYGAVGTHFESEEVKEKYGNILTFKVFNTVWEQTEPENLLKLLLEGGKGWLHLNTITIKRELLKKSGFFNTKMKQGQDTHFIWKLAASGNLTRQSIDKPVSLRRAHENNRVHNDKEAKFYHTYLVPEFYKWGKNIERVKKIKHLIPKRHLWWLKCYTQVWHGENWKKFYAIKLFQNIGFLPISLIISELKSLKTAPNAVNPNKNIQTLSNYQKLLFNSIINTVNHDYKNKKIYLYGSGAFLDLLVKHTQLSSLPICGIFDYDLTKEGKEVNGWRIYNSQNMKDFDIDLLLVTLYNPDKVKSFIDSNCDADKIYMI